MPGKNEPNHSSIQCTAFEGERKIASGEFEYVAMKTKEVADKSERERIYIFNDESGERIEVDLRGSAGELAARLKAKSGTKAPAGEDAQSNGSPRRGRGRPKLGVVAREVTLLPRHWEWLNGQPGGASVALRKLVEEARRANRGRDRARRSREAAYRFMLIMAGNRPGFEEAARSLFAGDEARFGRYVESWPRDVRVHAKKLAAVSFEEELAG